MFAEFAQTSATGWKKKNNIIIRGKRGVLFIFFFVSFRGGIRVFLWRGNGWMGGWMGGQLSRIVNGC